MTTHLRIERLIITGLIPDRPTGALRDAIERALAGLLTPDTISHLRSNPHLRLPPIAFDATAPSRTVAHQIALAIRDAMSMPDGRPPRSMLYKSTPQ